MFNSNRGLKWEVFTSQVLTCVRCSKISEVLSLGSVHILEVFKEFSHLGMFMIHDFRFFYLLSVCNLQIASREHLVLIVHTRVIVMDRKCAIQKTEGVCPDAKMDTEA